MVVLKNKALRSIMLAVLLAAGLLVAGLMASVEPAQATFPGDNGRIAFSSNRAPATSFQIYSVNSTGREADLSPVTTQLAGFDGDPVYSPDGTKIAFERNTGGNSNIWTISSTGGANANQITDNPAQDASPDYSPDGKRIAFTSNRAPATSFQIYSVSSTGREADLNPVTTQLAGTDSAPVYSPDGTKIAFQRTVGNANANIWTINSTGGANANQITDNPAEDFDPTWQSLPTAKPPPPGNPPGNPQANTDPRITDFKPAPNSRIQNRSPLISATVRDAEDNLAATDIKLFVDGNPIASADFSYNQTTDKLSYKTNQLSLGGHTVRIVATDTKGLSTQETWSFRVRRNAG